MQFIGEDKYKWQDRQRRIKKLRNAEEVARQYAQEVRQDKWDKWTPELQKYCENDTLVSLELYKYFQTQELDPTCYELEHSFAIIMALQENF